MKELSAIKAKRQRLLSALFLVVALSIPLLLSITGLINWSPLDFLLAGILLISLTLIINLVFHNIKKPTMRWLFIVGAILLFILLWMEMAVGLFGSSTSGS